MKLRVLVVDDEAPIRETLEEALQDAGFETRTAADGRAAAELALADSFDACVTDIRMPDMGGLDLLRRLGETSPETAVLLMTAHADLATALEALRLGAVDYLIKPFREEELLAKLRRIGEHRRMALEIRNLRRAADPAAAGASRTMVGESAAMRKVLEMVDRMASLPSNVLVTGESGTGKELVARALHDRGSRAKAPFVPINCAAIPEALLESELFGHVKGAFTGAAEAREGLLKTAGDGTIFLDELGEMPLALQAKLLRAIESREVQPVGSSRRIPIQARLVVATHRDLKAEVQAGRFREDLYYRLAVVEIRIPPLRERREDIPLLVRHFLEKYGRELGRPVRSLSREAMARLLGHPWKGNIRELSNVIERAVIFASGEELEVADLPDPIRGGPAGDAGSAQATDLRSALRDFERAHILRVIEQCGGNKRKAAKLLGLGPSSLYRKLDASAPADLADPEPA